MEFGIWVPSPGTIHSPSARSHTPHRHTHTDIATQPHPKTNSWQFNNLMPFRSSFFVCFVSSSSSSLDVRIERHLTIIKLEWIIDCVSKKLSVDSHRDRMCAAFGCCRRRRCQRLSRYFSNSFHASWIEIFACRVYPIPPVDVSQSVGFCVVGKRHMKIRNIPP